MDSKTDTDLTPENFDDSLSDRPVPKWVKSGSWICAILIALPVLYFLVYPALAMLIYKALGEPSPVPSMLDTSIVPIEWVGEKNELYEGYTEWLSDLIL